MKIYIIWNVTQDRPAINADNYGNIQAYLSFENAQAGLTGMGETSFDYEVKKFELK